VKTILAELKDNPYEPVIASSTDPSGPSDDLIEFAEALESNPVSGTRDIIAISRGSGQRRHDLQGIIAAGNNSKSWPGSVPLRQVQLLRDCDTRWSSTFNMMDRLIELYPVSFFLYLKQLSQVNIIYTASRTHAFSTFPLRTYSQTIQTEAMGGSSSHSPNPRDSP
jgi:hypothetical protein